MRKPVSKFCALHCQVSPTDTHGSQQCVVCLSAVVPLHVLEIALYPVGAVPTTQSAPMTTGTIRTCLRDHVVAIFLPPSGRVPRTQHLKDER